MNSKNKPEANSLLRTPKAKNKLGLKIPRIAMPHDDLIFSEKPTFELIDTENDNEDTLTRQTRQTSQGSHTSMSTQTSQSRQTSHTKSFHDVSPTKNFQKVANSITKQAIPEGFFKGKDKHLYDVLYSLTRGSIEPKRKIRISKTKLMKLSGIGSRITFDSCIVRLEQVGLLKLKIFTGEHEGNEFEILLPEEIETLTSQSSQSSHTSHAQKLVTLVTLETSQTSQSPELINTGLREAPKTSFKDIKNDDEEAFAGFIKKFQTAAEEITGKKLSVRERGSLERLADLLILELKVASNRTDSISSIPAFLTEILRRKLISGNNLNRFSQTPKIKLDTTGKPTADGEYEKRPLDQAGREAALIELQDFAGDVFLEEFKKWYTTEDWIWLNAELDKQKLTNISDSNKISSMEKL